MLIAAVQSFKSNSNFVSKWDVKIKVKRESLARAFQREMVFATLSISSGVWWPGNHPDRILGSQSRDCLYSCVQSLLKQQEEHWNLVRAITSATAIVYVRTPFLLHREAGGACPVFSNQELITYKLLITFYNSKPRKLLPTAVTCPLLCLLPSIQHWWPLFAWSCLY